MHVKIEANEDVLLRRFEFKQRVFKCLNVNSLELVVVEIVSVVILDTSEFMADEEE